MQKLQNAQFRERMIILKSQEEIEKIAESCRIVAKTLDRYKDMVNQVLQHRRLETFCRCLYQGNRVPAFKGYRGYPASICTSVNNEVIHGIPSNRVLEEGDILGIDLGVYKDGFYGDAAVYCSCG